MTSGPVTSRSPTWRRFALGLLAVFAGGSAALWLLLAALDPWGALPLHAGLPRGPADHSQRWAYPELARDARFDSAVIGNSGSRLINPADLDPALGARFVNLAMVRAFPYEEMRLLDVFLAAHPQPRAVLIGMGREWCERADQGEATPRFGYEPLPEFLYGGGTVAALANLLNLHAIETAWRSLQAKLGFAPPPYGDNGYALIGVDFHPYDPVKAKAMIDRDNAEPWLPPPRPDPATWRFPALEWLAQRVDAMPASTRKLLVFVPRHHLYPAPGSVGAAMMDECKRRVVALARQRPKTQVLDLSIPSPITTEDTLWWDAVHLRPEPMAGLSTDLARAIAGEPTETVRVLTAPPGLAESNLSR